MIGLNSFNAPERDQRLTLHMNSDHLARALESELGIELKVAVSAEAVDVCRLTPRERGQLGGLANSPRRLSWLKGRSALKIVLREIGEDDETGAICFPNPSVSLTHSGEFAVALGTASGKLSGIGVDFEVHRPLRGDTGRFFLSESEQAWVMSVDESLKSKALLRMWTIKEALFKSDPRNLERWLSDYRIEAAGADAGRAFVCGNQAQEFRYSCLEVEEGFLSVAVLPRRHDDA